MEHFKFGHRQENFISCLDLACQHAADDLKLRRWKLLPQLDILIPPSLSTGLLSRSNLKATLIETPGARLYCLSVAPLAVIQGDKMTERIK